MPDPGASYSWLCLWFMFVLLSDGSWEVSSTPSWSLETISFPSVTPELCLEHFQLLSAQAYIPLQGGRDLEGKLAINALSTARFFPLVHWSFNFFEILLPSTEKSPWRVWEVVYESQICIHMILSFIKEIHRPEDDLWTSRIRAFQAKPSYWLCASASNYQVLT